MSGSLRDSDDDNPQPFNIDELLEQQRVETPFWQVPPSQHITSAGRYGMEAAAVAAEPVLNLLEGKLVKSVKAGLYASYAAPLNVLLAAEHIGLAGVKYTFGTSAEPSLAELARNPETAPSALPSPASLNGPPRPQQPGPSATVQNLLGNVDQTQQQQQQRETPRPSAPPANYPPPGHRPTGYPPPPGQQPGKF